MRRLLITILLLSLFISGCAAENKGNIDDKIDDREKNGIVEEEGMDGQEGQGLETEIDPQEEKDGVVNKVEVEEGKEAPDFALDNLYIDKISLSDFRGKIVLLNFWATWCQWCDLEMPDLNKLNAENEDLVVLAVNVMEDEWKVRRYIQDGGYEFEVAFDFDGKLAGDYLVEGLPSSFFIDKDGVLQLAYSGMLTYEQMIGVVDAIREMN